MSSVGRRLFLLEIRALLGQPLVIAVYALLFAAMLAGAANGAARVARERAMLSNVMAEEARALSAAKAASARYAKPSPLAIEYHRDPTDVFGYMNYFLVTHAVKPPLPLAALAIGQGDLQPARIRIDFNTVFPDAAYDRGNPRMLKLGEFDLLFVLLYLVPLGLIALGATRLTGEQDSGVLRMIAAQPVSLRTVAFAKAGAFAAISLLAIVGGMLLALLLAGALGNLLVLGVAMLVAMWVLFWVALSVLVASYWRGAVASVATLVLIWGALTVLVPTTVALAITTALPTPSRIAYIDASRKAMDGFYRDEATAYADWIARFPQYADRTPEMVKSPEVKRFARDAYYREALLPERDAFAAHSAAAGRAAELSRLLSPAMMLDGAVQAAAGTDGERHIAFVAAADAYGERLRRWFEPLALANAAEPRRSCAACPGRLNFNRYDDVPRFVPVAETGRSEWWSGFGILYLAAATVLLAAWATRRLRAWPV
jgi:ABC-2 type transport system permease protein